MRLLRALAIDFRGPVELESVLEPAQETGFDTLVAVVASEADSRSVDRVGDCTSVARKRGLQVVAYLADGSQGLRCLSSEEEVAQKIRRVRHLAAVDLDGIVFRDFATSCYSCVICAASLAQMTGLKLPRRVIGDAEEAKRWYYPDPMVYGFDGTHIRAERIEEVLQLVEWMGDRLQVVASRIAEEVAAADPRCRLGLAGLNRIGLKVLDRFSRQAVPIVVALPNTFVLSDELGMYIRKLPFEGLRREWSNLVATSAYYHAPEELRRIIIRAAIEGRCGSLIWAAGGSGLSFGRLEDMSPEHWRATGQAFRLIQDYEGACEGAEGAGGLYWTRKARKAGMADGEVG